MPSAGSQCCSLQHVPLYPSLYSGCLHLTLLSGTALPSAFLRAARSMLHTRSAAPAIAPPIPLNLTACSTLHLPPPLPISTVHSLLCTHAEPPPPLPPASLFPPASRSLSPTGVGPASAGGQRVFRPDGSPPPEAGGRGNSVPPPGPPGTQGAGTDEPEGAGKGAGEAGNGGVEHFEEAGVAC